MRVMKQFMKTSILTGFIILGSLTFSSLCMGGERVGISGRLQIVVSPWSAPCQTPVDLQPAQCGLPQAISGTQAQFFSLELGQATDPGQVAVAQQPFSSGLLSVYSVIPKLSENLPPYLQIRIELTGAGRAICMESVKWNGVGALPPLICAGLTSGSSLEEMGVTTQLYISATSPSI